MTRIDDFAEDVVKSGLVSQATLDRVRAASAKPETEDEPTALAKRLVEEKFLTNYQAKKLLGGMTKGFFLGGHRILRRLGQGGMGKVYLAVSEPDGFKVAIKVLPPKLASEGGQPLKRFRREMDLSQRVKHHNLARTIDVGEADGVYFMIMEYVPGDSLYNVVKAGGPFRVPDAARYFLQVLDGLNAAHDGGLIHRDIKPSNLMITPEGAAKILDLGLARASDEESALTRPNSVIGTLDYASPEQLSNASSADRRSDLYSLGCTLYFTLAGRAPFEGGDVINKIFKQRMEDPPPLEKITRGVPAAFAAIVKKLMAKEPNERYQTGADLQADLARWTDPKVVRSILGAEADAAMVFRPPPPELEDDDLRLLSEEKAGSVPGILLRDLGEAEPGAAPGRRVVPPARPAVLVETPSRSAEIDRSPGGGSWREDSSWLMPFIVVVCMLGALAIVLIAALGR
ncbi:MAG: serine/threonine protein kinase [Planctomycetota bacterium]|nr:serine/threonine protein kinase [Planctomycetota bacterium]